MKKSRKVKKKIKIFLIFFFIMIITIITLNSQYIFLSLRSSMIDSAIDDIDVDKISDSYPLILLHGFNPLYSNRIGEFSMIDLQNKLVDKKLYDNKNILTNKTTCIELINKKKPIIIRTTYKPSIQNNSIDRYSDNLKNIIDKITRCTGAKKVDIISHSMGGIVARFYISKNKNPKIRKLIMLGTPNNGGLYNIGDIANELAETDFYLFDFIELSKNSALFSKLDPKKNISYYTIAGMIDKKGDGLIKTRSVHLNYSKKFNVSCNHFTIKNPSFCPEILPIITNILK